MFKTILNIIIIIITLSSCRSKRDIAFNSSFSNTPSEKIKDSVLNSKFPIYTNDSVEKYNTYESIIINNTEESTTLNNRITHHFRKYITPSTLKKIKFGKETKDIHITFNLNRNKEPVNVETNANIKELDSELKKGFEELDFSYVEIIEFDSHYKYTLIVIQKIEKKAEVRCNIVAVGYTPPIYIKCTHEFNYDNLNYCNYQYLTEYIYNHMDLNLVRVEDIDFNHRMDIKFIVDYTGKVVAVKIESQNKKLLESCYNAVIRLPKAKVPAQMNGENYYYGYDFPTTINHIIRNNKLFKSYYHFKKRSGIKLDQMMKEYLVILDRVKKRNMIFNYKMTH
ncbi:hypothetical protein [Wenyingzhuangia sp. IMCC45574]